MQKMRKNTKPAETGRKVDAQKLKSENSEETNKNDHRKVIMKIRGTINREPHRFTLIELLVVIAIIVILAGMLLPMLNLARARAKEIKCVSNMKQFSPALMLYCADNNDMLPFKGEWVVSVWRDRIQPYLKIDVDAGRNPIFTCPEWQITCLQMGHNMNEHWTKNYYYCNNAQLADFKATRVKHPSTTGMIFDATFKGGNGAATKPSYSLVGWRHVKKNANFLYVDGHVDTTAHTGNSDHIITIFNL